MKNKTFWTVFFFNADDKDALGFATTAIDILRLLLSINGMKYMIVFFFDCL